MKNKKDKGQMEMSVGTIVTIVLLVTLLILGIVLIKNIFNSATSVVDLTDQQLREEINKLFSEDSKISIYPGTRLVEVRQEATTGVGVGIKNLLASTAGEKTFGYNVVVSDADLQSKCGVNTATAEGWIITGRSEDGIPIPSGDFTTQKVLFEIPVGSPLCTIRYRVNVVTSDGKIYATDFFDLKIKAK
jgi:hypothetical protein